jgi:hypothetical protein
MTHEEERAAVEAAWSDLDDDPFAGKVGHDGKYHVFLPGWFENGYLTPNAAWHAAYLYTVERQRQIAEVQEEIAWINECAIDPLMSSAQESNIKTRILAVEQQRLEDLQSGMKP